MKKRKFKIIFPFFIIAVLLISSTAIVFGASQITKTYKFYPASDKYLKYDVPKTVKKDGKEYELIDVNYRINEEETKEIIKNIQSKDKTDYPKEIIENLNGKEITFYVVDNGDAINWSQSEAEIRTQEYKNRNDIPQTIDSSKIDEDGNKIDIRLALSDTKNISRAEKFSAPAKFYSPSPDGKLYMFNGKKVVISGGSPTWNSYREDVKDYLGINGNTYSITGGHWTSQPVLQDNQYVRTASFTGTKVVPVYRATFIETADTTTYSADITYKHISAEAVAAYEPITNIAKIIAIGAGLVALIAAVIGILWLLAKRRKSQNEE